MAKLTVVRKDNKFKVETQGFFLEFPDTSSNRKACVVFLRNLRDKRGKNLFKLKELAKIVDSENRQGGSFHVEEFRNCGEDFLEFLKHKHKVNEEVLKALEEEIEIDPLSSEEELAKRVNERLGRNDISAGNINSALEEIGCKVMRRSIKKKLETEDVSYDEKYLLDMAFGALSEVKKEKEVRILERAGISEYIESEGMKVINPKEEVQMLLDPEVKVSSISCYMKCVVFCLVLYFWGVPLGVLGNWLKVNKTTVLRWIIGLTESLWQVIVKYIDKSVKGNRVYIDEKWIKIKGVWHYWNVVIDVKTNLPIYWTLTYTRSQYSCYWIMFKLKSIGYNVKVFITDGFLGYAIAITKFFPEAIHQLCHFHFQGNVTRWLKDNFEDDEEIESRRVEMQKVLQTNYKRTFLRRFSKLEIKAKILGITEWIKNFLTELPKLIPAVGSKVIPRTTNAIERFFRAFNRFYKTRGGFHSYRSATREFILFVVVYLFTKGEQGKAPIETVFPLASRTPFYQLVNNPLQILFEMNLVKKPVNQAVFQYSLISPSG